MMFSSSNIELEEVHSALRDLVNRLKNAEGKLVKNKLSHAPLPHYTFRITLGTTFHITLILLYSLVIILTTIKSRHDLILSPCLS